MIDMRLGDNQRIGVSDYAHEYVRPDLEKVIDDIAKLNINNHQIPGAK